MIFDYYLLIYYLSDIYKNHKIFKFAYLNFPKKKP